MWTYIIFVVCHIWGCLWCKETKNRKRLLLIGVLDSLDWIDISRSRCRSGSTRCGKRKKGVKELWIDDYLCFGLPEY